MFGKIQQLENSVEMEPNPLQLVVQAQVGSRLARLLVGSGAKHTTLFDSRRDGWLWRLQPVRQVSVHDLTGIHVLQEVVLPTVCIGGSS